MKQLLNFIPLVFFFVFLSLYDIFVGVQALMITATISFLVIWFIYKKIDKIETFSYLMIIIFGAITLYFRNQDIIKWKVVIINFLFASVLLISQVFFNKNLIQKVLGKELQLDTTSWNMLNTIWILFFSICGLVGIFLMYFASDYFFWLFKVFILPGCSLLLTLIIGIYIYKKMDKANN